MNNQIKHNLHEARENTKNLTKIYRRLFDLFKDNGFHKEVPVILQLLKTEVACLNQLNELTKKVG